MMVTIVGISGSLRKHSFNAGLLRAAAEAVPEGCTLEIESMGKFDEEGNLADDGVMKQLTKYMSGFADFVKRMQA